MVWTGDSARHDNDRDIPRSTQQVENLNRFVVDKFVETFGKTDNIHDPDPTNDFVIPIIPTFGNNDILPHNIFEPGPNKWTKKYIDIWQKFVPEDQYHSFERGGWFFTEVIPNKLAVFSLNTLYFFDSNSAVDGCDEHTEPGYEHMEWLRIQLQFLRQRGMKAILTGHVPPARTENKQMWDESCYQKYTLWLRQYRDVIVGSLYGHMNIDHFMFQDVRDLTYKFKIRGIDDEGLRPSSNVLNPAPKHDFNAKAKATYLLDLRESWSSLPTPPKGISYALTDDKASSMDTAKKSRSQREREKFLREIGGKWGERFSLSLVSPSVVPNYFPTLRIVEYNVSGLEHDHPAIGSPQGKPAEESDLLFSLESEYHQNQAYTTKPKLELRSESDLESTIQSETKLEEDVQPPNTNKKKKHKKKKKNKKPKPNFRIPNPPSSTSPPGPAYSPQTFSLLSWTQLYANLTQIHEKMAASTIGDEVLADTSTSSSSSTITKPKGKKHFTYKIEYKTNNDSTYRMHDLTLRSWLDIAERMGRAQLHHSPIGIDTNTETELDTNTEIEIETYTPTDSNTSSLESNDTDEDNATDSIHTSNINNGDDLDPDKNKKKKHKKHKSKGKLSDNRLWHMFIKRAYVHAKPDSELEQDFG